MKIENKIETDLADLVADHAFSKVAVLSLSCIAAY